MNYMTSSKSFGHDLGLSCTFRQWRAESHCRFLHGYALAIHLTFMAEQLDKNGWVMDFGRFKGLRATLESYFDHTTLVARDDPNLDLFEQMSRSGLIQLVVVDGVGCEAFTRIVHDIVVAWLGSIGEEQRVKLMRVQVSEHGANSAAYISNVRDIG